MPFSGVDLSVFTQAPRALPCLSVAHTPIFLHTKLTISQVLLDLFCIYPTSCLSLKTSFVIGAHLSDRHSSFHLFPFSPLSYSFPQSLVSAMASLRKVVVTAIIKSLLRGKSLIQAILAYWISPLVFDEVKKGQVVGHDAFPRTIQDFLKEAETALLGPVSGNGLQTLSAGLKKQFVERLQSDPECMLPSFNHQLPTGDEAGQYLALDVGGSTLRVALVDLSGRGEDGTQHSKILNMRSFRIDKPIKDLKGTLFFDWMAARISETLSADQREKASDSSEPLPIALAWSFPIE